MEQLSTRNGIEARFNGRLSTVETSYQSIVREAPQGCKHVVSSDRLGSYLTALAATLNEGPGRPKEANCLLLTPKHAMALHVERKRKDGVDYFSAKLYDPNDTATFTRVERPTAEALGPLTLKDMLISPGLIRHYAGEENTSFAFWRPDSFLARLIKHYAGEGNASLSMAAVSLSPDLQPQMDRSATTHSAQNVLLALRYGVFTELPSMLQAVLNSNLSEKEKAELLAAKSGHGTPGLLWAFHNGHTDTVKAFTDAVLNSKLDKNVKAELLEPVRRSAWQTVRRWFQHRR